MNHEIERKRDGEKTIVTTEQWAAMVTRGQAKSFKVARRNIPEVPVEVAQVIQKMKSKGASLENKEADPEGETPGQTNQNNG